MRKQPAMRGWDGLSTLTISLVGAILNQLSAREAETMADYETIVYEQAEDKIFRLTLNRPEKLNAMSQKLLRELDGALDEFENNPAASVLIIRGAGRAFCAGYDLQPTQQAGSGFTVTSDRIGLQKMVDRWQRLWSLPKPVIAQVHGYCLAGAT